MEEVSKIGRPTDFTQELADLICAELASGKSLRTVCGAENMPDKATVFRWLRQYQPFCDQYTRAKEEGCEAWADEMLDIADSTPSVITGMDKSDSARVHAEQLRIDTRKWVLSKLKPKKYGDKLDLSNNGKDFPTPILNSVFNAVPSNNSDQKGHADVQTNPSDPGRDVSQQNGVSTPLLDTLGAK